MLRTLEELVRGADRLTISHLLHKFGVISFEWLKEIHLTAEHMPGKGDRGHEKAVLNPKFQVSICEITLKNVHYFALCFN